MKPSLQFSLLYVDLVAIERLTFMRMFILQNMYMNFGEIGNNIKELMDEFQKKSQSQAKVESIADMKVCKNNFNNSVKSVLVQAAKARVFIYLKF